MISRRKGVMQIFLALIHVCFIWIMVGIGMDYGRTHLKE